MNDIMERFIVNFVGEFEDNGCKGYITADEFLIWTYGGLRSLIYCDGCDTVLMGQPIANLYVQPIIKWYNDKVFGLVKYNKHKEIREITVGKKEALEELVYV